MSDRPESILTIRRLARVGPTKELPKMRCADRLVMRFAHRGRGARASSLGLNRRRSSLYGPLLVMAVGALIGSGSAIAATTPRALTPSYLFSIPTASGSLTGRNDQHLTLRLRGTRDYLTRFTDRPLRQATVVANVDFARRFETYFAEAAPNAVLTYTPRGAQIPVSIVLTITAPRWNPKRSTWTFRATRIRKKSDTLPGSTGHINHRGSRTPTPSETPRS